MFRKSLLIAAAAMVLTPVAASAHHSFAAFFSSDKIVKVSGKVKSFRFGNPHGTIVLEVAAKDGSKHEWRVETSAPVTLQRRGWDRTTLKPGQVVTIEGWLARNGKRYLRLRQAFDSSGKPVVKTAFTAKDD